jgi:hypothetical protein
VLASSAQPPGSVMIFSPVVFDVKFHCHSSTDPGQTLDRVKYGGSTLPKNSAQLRLSSALLSLVELMLSIEY